MAKHSYVFSRAVKRPAVDFVGFVIWDLYKSQGMIWVSRNGTAAVTTRNPSAPLTHPAYNVHYGIFRPDHDCRARPVQRT